jgi:NhaP-type Na+/H+ or K+/H+ antiporter
MLDPSDFIVGCIVAGLLLIAMTLAGSFIERLPLSAAMLYLGAGVAIGPMGLGLIKLSALTKVVMLERLT